MKLRVARPSSPLVFGGAIDEALNFLLEQKKKGLEVSVPLAQSIFEVVWERQKVNGAEVVLSEPGLVKYSKADLDEGLLLEEDYASGKDLSWCSLKRKGFIIIEEYAKQILPLIEEVILVQHDIELPNELGDKLVGKVDLLAKINGKIWLCDNKTSSRRYTANSANESEQLATYYEALRTQYDIAGVAYIVIPKSVRKIKEPRLPIEIIYGKIGEPLLEKTFQQYDDALMGIRSGDFRCSGCRSAKFGCDYRKFCDSNGKDLTGLVKLTDK